MKEKSIVDSAWNELLEASDALRKRGCYWDLDYSMPGAPDIRVSDTMYTVIDKDVVYATTMLECDPGERGEYDSLDSAGHSMFTAFKEEWAYDVKRSLEDNEEIQRLEVEHGISYLDDLIDELEASWSLAWTVYSKELATLYANEEETRYWSRAHVDENGCPY